jgi:hypothetical protein
MMMVKASKNSEAGKMPSEELLAAMGKYNEELMKAGVLVEITGLQPTSKGPGEVFGRQAHRRGRTVHGDQRADRRLLDDQRKIEGRGDPVSFACSLSTR